MHLNRTGISIIQPTLFIANVEFLEILLSPYIDDEYDKDIKDKSQKATAIAALDPMFHSKGEIEHEASIKTAVHNIRCLMKLAERKGLLLEKIDYGYDKDEEE